MAEKKVSELPSSNTLTNCYILGVDANGVSVKIPIGTIMANLLNEKQEKLRSGDNIKTINGSTLLGPGNIVIQGGGGGATDYSELDGKPKINGTTLNGNKSSQELGLQDALVSGNNIKTVNNTSLLGAGNIEIEGEPGRDGQDAVNPFKGWFRTDNIPTTGQEGDYCNVSNTSVTPHTVTIYRWSTAQNKFVDTGEVPDTANAETFASSEELNQVAIDDSHLVNPVNTVDATQPVLAQAEDVMQLKSKLEGVSASEVKVNAVVGINVTTGKYVSGETGALTTPSSYASQYGYFTTEIPQGTKSIRFMGGSRPSSSYKSGYTLGYYDADNNNVFVPVRNFYFPVSTSFTTKEIIVDLEEGETVFMTTCMMRNGIQLSQFYCYLQSGDTVKEMIPVVVNDYTGGADKALSAEKGKEIAEHISDLERCEVVKYDGKTFSTPNIGEVFNVSDLTDANYTSVRVYNVEGDVDYYLYGAWQKSGSNYYIYIFTDANDVVLSRIYGQDIPISRETTSFLLWENYKVTAPSGAVHLYEKCPKAASDSYHHTDYYQYKNLLDTDNIDNYYEGGVNKVMGADAGKYLYEKMATWSDCTAIGDPLGCTTSQIDGLEVGDNVEEAVSVPPANPYSYLYKYAIDSTKSYHLEGNHLALYGRWWLIWADADGNYLTKQYKSSKNSRAWDIIVSPSDMPEGAAYLYVNVVRGGIKYNDVEVYELVSIDDINERIKNSASKREFRILCIGDSFTQDAIEYMPFLFHKTNPDINLRVGLLYRASTGITKVYEQYMYCKNEDAEHNFGKNFNYYESDGVNAWEEVTSSGALYSVQDALDENDWDIVTFGNTAAYDVDTTTSSYDHQPHILDAYISLINEISLYVSHPIKIGALSVCNAISRTKTISGQDVRVNYKYDDTEGANTYNATWPTIQQIYGWTMDDVQLVAKDSVASFVIPVWTAVMDAYTVDVIRSIGHYGDDVYTYNTSHMGYLRADGRHLQEGLPCQIAAYTVVEALSRLLGTGHSILGDNTMFDATYVNQLNIPGKNGDPTGYPDGDGGRNIRFAQKCAIMANNHPFEQMDMNSWY